MSSKVRGVRALLARVGLGGERRGVVAVVSMMFLILFGSLAAAMAIMSRSNIVTAATHQHVTRALGAAETGLAIAQRRLSEAVSRFPVSKGEIDANFGERIWTGAFLPSDGAVLPALPPTSFVNTLGDPDGVAEAVGQAHAQDTNIVVVQGVSQVTIGPAPAGTDPAVYDLDNWVRTPAVALTAQSGQTPANTAFQVDYAPLASGTDIRVIVTGYDFDYGQGGNPVTRRIMQDFRIVKRVDAAVVSPTRIMIGKNVMVEGDLGATYDKVTTQYGDPLVLRSDFFGIDATLDGWLTKLFNGLATYDVDQDNRLRIGHPVEKQGLPDIAGTGSPGGPELDVTNDGYVDEFDLFMKRFDANADGKVVLSAALTAGTPAAGVAAEFTADDDLGFLLDSAMPDRNKNGIYSFTDVDGDGRFSPATDRLDDTEPASLGSLPPELQTYLHTSPSPDHVWKDQILGYRDGVIDERDPYAKVQGKLVFRTTSSAWTAGQGSYMSKLRGPIHPPTGEAPLKFGATGSELPDINSASFVNSETALKAAADGDGRTFDEQVASNLGISMAALATWTAASNSASPDAPKYYPLSPDSDLDGRPDNWATATYEKTPYNSPNFSDWYYRPVYENMTFRNIQIPAGTNALFKKCTFVGVTYVRCTTDNTHVNWTLYGKMKMDTGSGRPGPDPERQVYGDAAGETSYPTMLPASACPPNQMILMATTPLDKGDIPANQVAFVIGYNNLPDPLVVSGKRITDTKPLSNNCRFHDCLFVGSIVSDAPQSYTHVRNKLQFTGGTKFVEKHPTDPEDPALNPDPEDEGEIAKSSLMLPQYSVDLGSFNSPPTQNLALRGAIVAGVLDVRGNASINGVLMLTFAPTAGQAPLVDPLGNPVGNPSLFNATLGYFGPDDGDDESLDPATLPIINIAGTPTKIVGYDTDGDGLPDTKPTDPQPVGSTPVPFYGYGHINLRFDPGMVLPDGIVMPLQLDARPLTYREASK
ncbi:MAG: hypothetical protein IT437_12390 [Phycisphaerales bacterium]|nr:hypothetical protein [Phycisphaerales bacterium]